MKPTAEGPGICSSFFTCRDAGAGMTSAQRSVHPSSRNALLPSEPEAASSSMRSYRVHPARAGVLWLYRWSVALLRTPFFGSNNGMLTARRPRPRTWTNWCLITWNVEILYIQSFFMNLHGAKMGSYAGKPCESLPLDIPDFLCRWPLDCTWTKRWRWQGKHGRVIVRLKAPLQAGYLPSSIFQPWNADPSHFAVWRLPDFSSRWLHPVVSGFVVPSEPPVLPRHLHLCWRYLHLTQLS